MNSNDTKVYFFVVPFFGTMAMSDPTQNLILKYT